MKFNFEKIGNTTKKIVVGTTIASTLSMPVEAGVRIKNQNDKQKDHSTKINIIPEKYGDLNEEIYRKEYIEYMRHPSYKIRLAKEMFGDEFINEEKQKIIDNEYVERLNQIMTIPIYMIPKMDGSQDTSHYNLTNNNIFTTAYAAPHELTHAVQHTNKFMSREKGFNNILEKFIKDREFAYFRFLKSQETEDYYKNILLFSVIVKNYLEENKNSISLSIPEDYLDNGETPYDFVMTLLNEPNIKDFTLDKYEKFIDYKSKAAIENNNQIKELRVKILIYLKKLKEFQNNYFYYYKNEEIKARLNHLRIRAINEFRYDLNDEFDINKYQELQNDKQYNELKDNLNLDDEQINELMKYTAMDTGTEDYYHPNWNYEDINNNQA